MNTKFDQEIENLTIKKESIGIVETVKQILSEEAAMNEKLTIARRMVKSGLTYAMIKEFTQLNKGTIKKMKKELLASSAN